MAIVTLDKLTVYGTSHDKDAVLEGLQQLGCLHLISLRGESTRQPQLVSKEARDALRYLQGCPIQRRQSRALAGYDLNQLVVDVLALQKNRGRLREERDELQQAIAELRPWGDFQLPPAAEFDAGGFWFYVVPNHRFSDFPKELTWHVANRDEQFTYVVVLAEEPPEKLRMTPVELDSRPLSQLQERLETVEEQLEELHWCRVTLTRWRDLLRRELDVADDRAAQQVASASTLDDGEVFAIQGWAPRVAVADVRAFCEERGLALTAEAPHAKDTPPTLLKNPDRVAGAEGCVTFYITPAYAAWDPTTIVFFSFSLFFAMIVSDAGYGLVMGVMLMLFWGRLGGTASTARFRYLLLGIVASTITYGVIVGSYFGLAPPVGTMLDALQVKIDGKPMMSQQTAMMTICVAIGIAHLVLANTVSAWQRRTSPRCLGHLGWAMIMVGGFLFGLAALTDAQPLMLAGELLVPVGAAAVLLFSSEQPLMTRSILAHLRRMLDGLMQFANISKAFGDALSYLRLFALGLASAQLAVTFNDLAEGASHAGGLGLLLALLILLVGHGINLLLGLMSGVVHGLRLNCIEFFNWSLTEEGYAFQPFRRKAAN